MQADGKSGLVLGGGGITGIAWELGLLAVSSIVVAPDPASRAAIGNNVLDPARRRDAAHAGHAQAAAVAEQLRTVWCRPTKPT